MFGLDKTKRGPNGEVHCGESLGGVLGDGLEALSVGVEAVELEACLDNSEKEGDKKFRKYISNNFEGHHSCCFITYVFV